MLPRPHTIGRPSICPSAALWWLRGRAVASAGVSHAEHKASNIVPATAALCGVAFTPMVRNECRKPMAARATRSLCGQQIMTCDEKAPHEAGQVRRCDLILTTCSHIFILQRRYPDRRRIARRHPLKAREDRRSQVSRGKRSHEMVVVVTSSERTPFARMSRGTLPLALGCPATPQGSPWVRFPEGGRHTF
jgi:hypothetical protein